MENTEIVFVCNSTNNKNIRANELKILKKYPEELYFKFGESEQNAKKRYYNDLEILNKDFEKIQKIKKEIENEKKKSIKEDKSLEDEEEIKEKRSARKSIL